MYFLFFFTLKIVLNDFGCIFGVVVLLQNKFGANHTPPWWYCMMDKYLPVFLCIENTINPDQISNSICRNAAPNVQGTSTMLHCCLQTLIIVPLSSPWRTSCLLLQPNISNFDSSVQSTCCHSSAPQFLCFRAYLSRLAWFPHQRYGFLAATLPWRPLLARLLRTVDGCTWVPLVSASSELMALLDIFRFRRVISLMCLSSAALSFLGRPLRLRSSALPVSLCFFKRAWTAHLETPVCFEIFVWERPCSHYFEKKVPTAAKLH